MKDVLLITNYFHFALEKSSSRYLYLANLISQEDGLDLEVVTSTFYHATKRQREYSKEFLNEFEYQINLIYEPGYNKNISLKRLHSHRVYAKNILKYLKVRKKPDVIYLVVPSLDVADMVSKYCEMNNIRLIVDIQDLWPESFKMAFNIPVISDIFFYPMLRKANRIYSRADEIIAVSDTFVKRGILLNKKDAKGISVYIGTDVEFARKCISTTKLIKQKDEFWIMYVGTLSHSYNIKLVIDAISLLNKEGKKNIIFKVLGTGPMEQDFKSYAKEKEVYTDFLGMVEYKEMMAILASGDVAVNPIIKTSVSTIINKVGDYAAAGIPVINTQNSKEYRDLLVKYDAGVNCDPDDVDDLKNAINLLLTNKNLREQFSKNQSILANDLFDRSKTYKKIIDLLHSI